MRTGWIVTGDTQPRRRCQLLIRQHIPFVFGPHIPHPIVGNQQFCNINVPTTFGVLPFTKGGDQTLNIDTTMVNHLIPTDVIGVQVGVSFALSKGFGHRFETFVEIQFTFSNAGNKGFYVQPFGIEGEVFVVDHFTLSEFNLVEHVVEEGFEIGEMGVDGGV